LPTHNGWIRPRGNTHLQKTVTEAFAKAYPNVPLKTWVNKAGQFCASTDKRQWNKEEPNLDPENNSKTKTGPWGVVMGLDSGIINGKRTTMVRVYDASAGQYGGVFGSVIKSSIDWAKDHSNSIESEQTILAPTLDVSKGIWRHMAQKFGVGYKSLPSAYK